MNTMNNNKAIPISYQEKYQSKNKMNITKKGKREKYDFGIIKYRSK